MCTGISSILKSLPRIPCYAAALTVPRLCITQRQILVSSHTICEHITVREWFQYLDHSISAEVRCLWSHFCDSNMEKEYLFSTIMFYRERVTPVNQHLCPVRPSYFPSKDNSTAQSAGQDPVSSTAAVLCPLQMNYNPSVPRCTHSSQKY